MTCSHCSTYWGAEDFCLLCLVNESCFLIIITAAHEWLATHDTPMLRRIAHRNKRLTLAQK